MSGQLLFPIWAGGRTHGDIVEADATLKQRRAEYENVRARVEADVRNAYLDLNAAAEQVRVAQSRRELARDELTQSTDRFASGVADTVEVDAGTGSGVQRGAGLHRQFECPQPGQGQRGARHRPGRKNHARSFEEPITMAVDELQQSSPPRPAEPAGESSDAERHRQQCRGRRRTLLFAAIVGCVILVGAVSFWLYSRRYESTDDAQVDGHLNGITARIDGDVKAVYVEENQSVKAGELLVELDPRDYQVAVEQAQAQLLKAQAEERAENPNLPITQSTSQTSISTSQSEVANAEAAVAAAERDQAAAQSRLAGGGGE